MYIGLLELEAKNVPGTAGLDLAPHSIHVALVWRTLKPHYNLTGWGLHCRCKVTKVARLQNRTRPGKVACIEPCWTSRVGLDFLK